MWREITIETSVVQFSDGKFFKGVKGKCVRKTDIVTDAKRVSDDVLSDRDLAYLKGMEYEIVPIRISVTGR